MVNPSILRAYDIRGIVGKTLIERDVAALGRGFAAIVRRDVPKLGGRPVVVVGYDGRVSSPALEKALVDGLSNGGVDVIRVGIGPTPMLYYAVHAFDAQGGVMVTGSHNPPDYNGMKFMLGKGSFHGEQIQELGRLACDAAEVPDDAPGKVQLRNLLRSYVERLLQDLDPDVSLNAVWDAGNGSAGEALSMMVSRLPGTHKLLYADIDGSFPNHHPDPTVAANLADLIAEVRAGGFDLGIALDGDGDRIGVVDGEGEILWGDQLMAILAADVLAGNPGATIIADVKASQVLYDEIARNGGKPLMWRTGHSLIKEKMKEVASPLAGEMSGHIFFADGYYGFDDALYAAIRLLNAVVRSGRSLADLRKALPAMVNTPEIRFECPDERKFDVIEEVRERLSSRKADVNNVDGVRVQVAGGWWLLRASNTQPALVARCEGPDDETLQTIKADLVAVIEPSGVSLPDA
jgi:phosphomannomutase